MQCEVLWILHKILIYRLPDVLCTNKLELSKLFIIVEDRSQSSFTENRILAMRILVNLSGKLSGRTEMECDEVSSESLPSRVISLIIDQLIFEVKHGQDFGRTQAEAESQSLFNLLLCLVKEHPDLHVLVLDNIHIVIENMVIVTDILVPTLKPCSFAHGIVESNGKRSTSISLKFIIYIYKFLVVFLEILNKDGSISKEIFQKMKLIVRDVHQCSLFNSFTHTLYCLLLHSYIIWDRATILGMNNLVEHEDIFLLYVTKMLSQGDNWLAYKAGLHAACQGSWSIAAFIFEHLKTKVQSRSFYCWLECLEQLAKSEREIQLLSIQKNYFHLPEYHDKLVISYSNIGLSCAALEANAASSEAFYFQNWFLNLRAKVVETVLNILEVLVTFSSDQDSIDNKVWDKRLYFLTHCLTRLSKKLDLIVTSFVGMDRKSLEAISALTLSCSVLAFTIAFVHLISDFTSHGNSYVPSLKKSENISPMMLIGNLMARLRHADHETCTKLRSLLKMTGQINKSFHLDSRNQIISCGGSDIKEILGVCSYAVDGVIHLRSTVDTMDKEKILVKATKDGMQLLADVIKKWVHIPFRTPKSFFRLRPCMGSEIFAMNSDFKNSDDISVFSGSHLSLNVCLQLKNVISDHPIHLSKLYCILYCKTSFQMPPSSNRENIGHTWFGSQGWESDDMVDLNDKLSEYVRRKKTNSEHCMDPKEGGETTSYLCLEPNERGQGFTTCLIDVSGFPAGSYEIRWLSCCIDSQGLFWSLVPLNAGPVFNIQSPVFM